METQTPPAIDLSKFCSDDLTRPHLCNPFSDGDWTHAADGRLMVRVPKRSDCVELARLDGPLGFMQKFHDAWKAWPTCEIEWFPLPELPTNDASPCPVRGDNHSDCDECDGDGTVRIWPKVTIGHRTFNSMFLHKISSLPSPLVGRDYGAEEDKAMPFKFDGGCGLVMGMRTIKTIRT